MERQRPINVHGEKKEGFFIITGFDDSSITLKNRSEKILTFKKQESIRFYTSIDNTFFTFTSRVIKCEESSLVIENSNTFCKNPERKYERINTHNMHVSFFLKGDTIELNFPKTDTFAIIEKPKKSEEFDDSSIAGLTKSFKEYIGGKVSEYNIVMYRDKAPACLEEKLITRLGKILWIPDTEAKLPDNDPMLSSLVITEQEFADFLSSTGTGAPLVKSEIAAFLYKKSKNNIYSEIYCPILYHEYAIGFIYVENNNKENKTFDVDFVQYVYQFSKVLSYSLEKHGYFEQQSQNMIQHQEPIIDMSAAGLLFATQSEDIDNKINLLEDIDITINIKQRKIVVGSRIMRKFKDHSTFYFGVQYLKISDADFQFLFEYLYGRSFTKRDEMIWEGGSPPPQI
ncbi:MAG: PilZ domain-containing protein [Spirochaetales bacterium]|nr:PilZ domain-containing protein [Spirochaetales bacterium]